MAEGGAETSSGMCLTVDGESGSPLSQAMDNPSLRTDKLANSSLTREINFRNRESMNKRKDNSPALEGSPLILMISRVCTLSSCDQAEIERLNAGNSNSNEVDYNPSDNNMVDNNQSDVPYVDLVSDHETDQVLVISDTDGESVASSLLDSDSSLLDLSEIPESEKSLLLENVSPPHNYAREFPRRTQVKKKRRKKKKQATQKKRKTSVKTTPNPEPNERSDETISNNKINLSSNQGNLESTSSSEMGNINLSSISSLVNESSEEESFQGFGCEEAGSNNLSVEISAPGTVEKSMEANNTHINHKKVVDSAQHMSGNHICLSNVGDNSECFTFDNPNLISRDKNINCKTTDLSENDQLKHADNIVKTTSNPAVLKLLAKNDENYNKSISNNFELSKLKNNNHSNAILTSLQEECSNKRSLDDVSCDSGPSELSRNIKNIIESNIDSGKSEVIATPHQAGNNETAIGNILVEEHISKKETLKTKTKPVVEKRSKSDHISKTKRAYKNKKLKIVCSLALKQAFGEITHSLSSLNKAQHLRNKSGTNISSETDLLPGGYDDSKINFRSEIESNEVGLGLFDIPISQFFNVSYNSIDDTQSPKKSGLGLELHSPKSHSSGNCSEDHGALSSSIYSADLPRSSEMVLGSKSTSGHEAGPEKGFKEVSLKNISTESSLDTSQAQFEISSSKIASEVLLKSKSSENNSEMTSISSSPCTSYSKADYQLSKGDKSTKLDSSETTHEADLESQLFTENSEIHQNSISERNSTINTSQNQIESGIELEYSKFVSECSNLLEDKANLMEQNIDEVKKSRVNSSQKLQSCKLESTKSLEVSNNPSGLIPNMEKCKPQKIRNHREKSKSRQKLSNDDSSKDLSKFIHGSSKQKQQTKTKPEVNVDVLPSSELNLSQEQSLSETHEDSVVLMKSNLSAKPEDSIELNSSVKVSEVHSSLETKNIADESNLSPPLDEELSKCFKNLAEANKRQNLNTTLMTKDEKNMSIGNQNTLKEIDDPTTTDVCFIRNQGCKSITNEMDENVLVSRDFKKQESVENSTVHSHVETKDKCDEMQVSPALDLEFGKCSKNLLADTQGQLRATLTAKDEEKMPVEIEQNDCSISNRINDKNIKNVMDENDVNTVSSDSEITKHDWYKICISDCSTCHNTAALKAKHNIIKNDSICVCFYCKGKIIDSSLDTPNSQVSSTCSCQENKNNFSVNCTTVEKHEDSEASNDGKQSRNTPLIGSDLNSNYKTNKSPEEQKSPSKDSLEIVCKEMNTLEPESSLNLSDVLSPEKSNMTSQSEQNPIQFIPGFIEKHLDSPKVRESNSQFISEKIDPEIQSVANMNNDKSIKTPIKSRILQTCDEAGRGYDERRHELMRRYYNEVFKVRVILKNTNKSSSNNGSSSLLSHVETFWVNNRKGLRELLKSRYFSANDKHLIIYTDVCGFRYARLFIENIPERIDPRVVFETGGDISYYLEKLIKCHKTEKIINPRIVLIVYGNTLIPDKDIFHLLQLASNLNNIKLIVTTIMSQQPSVLNFNKKLMYYSKRYGYYVWDITKIHFLTNVHR